MGVVYNNAGIVTDGLVLALDAANSKSYPGSGTTWFDLSGQGNHFTLFNGPTYSSENFGALVFDGVNDYACSTSTLDLSTYNNITLEIAFKENTTTATGMAFEHSSNWNSNSGGFGLLPNSSGSTTYLANSHHTNHREGSGGFNYNGTIGTDIVVHTNIFSRVSDSTGRLAYINAFQRNNTTGSSSTGSYVAFRNDFLFLSSRNGTGIFANRNLYYVFLYGKKLSTEEISKNFNALRGRYGI